MMNLTVMDECSIMETWKSSVIFDLRYGSTSKRNWTTNKLNDEQNFKG